MPILVIILFLLSGCDNEDFQYRGIWWWNNTITPVSRQDVVEQTTCWINSVPTELRHYADETIDFHQAFDFADDEAGWMPTYETYNGMTNFYINEVWVRALSTDLTKTAYFHELGHRMRLLMYDDPDAGHVDKEFWRGVESVPNRECQKKGQATGTAGVVPTRSQSYVVSSAIVPQKH